MNPSASGLLGCLVAWPLTCWAQSAAVADSGVCTVDDARPFTWLSADSTTLLPEHERFLVNIGGAAPHLSATAPVPNLQFHDHLDYVARVRALRGSLGRRRIRFHVTGGCWIERARIMTGRCAPHNPLGIGTTMGCVSLRQA